MRLLRPDWGDSTEWQYWVIDTVKRYEEERGYEPHPMGMTMQFPVPDIDAWDTHEWLPGRTALLHRVDAFVGDQKVEGAEIIGFDPARHCYVTLYFGTDGPAAYEANFAEADERTVWEMRSDLTRFSGTFSTDGDIITGHWEQREKGGPWQPWMDITLTKR